MRLGWPRHILTVQLRLAVPPTSTGAPLVLLVDDEPDQVEMYQLALEFAGLTVITAFTGRDALESARTRVPAVIVLDLRLPDMSGWDVCRALKSDSQTAPIPIIILTAAASLTLPEQAKKAGCVGYLVKPCFPDVLTRTVTDVIEGRPPTG